MLELEQIIEEVGGSSRFQQRLLYLIIGPLYLIIPLSWMNGVLVLHEPDHWCSHPMTRGLNDSRLQEWKDCYLPRTSKGHGAVDGCKIKVPKSSPDFWSDEGPFTTCDFGQDDFEADMSSNSNLLNMKG